jgi:hypothetical protein
MANEKVSHHIKEKVFELAFVCEVFGISKIMCAKFVIRFQVIYFYSLKPQKFGRRPGLQCSGQVVPKQIELSAAFLKYWDFLLLSVVPPSVTRFV